MHHSLAFYGKHQHRFLRLYLSLARFTQIPLVGGLVRWIANYYARQGHSGYYLTLAEAEKIVELSRSVWLGPCSCRKLYRKCDNPVFNEIILGDGASGMFAGRKDDLCQITVAEAKELLLQGQSKHLTHSLMRCGEHFYAICSCCSCCCVPTRLRLSYGIGGALVRNPDVVRDFQRHSLD